MDSGSSQSTLRPPEPISPCSMAELGEFGRLLRRLGNRGLAAMTETVWTRPDRRPVIVLTALIGLACTLLATVNPVAAGVLLVIVFPLWTLEAAGFGTALSWASPKRATQDAFHRSAAANRRSRVLLLVRTSSPRRRSAFARQMELSAWPLLGAGIVVLAALAATKGIVDSHAHSKSFDSTVALLMLLPGAFFLVSLAVAVVGSISRAPWDAMTLSGIGPAVEALGLLEESGGPAPDLMIVGAATEGRDRRVLRRHRECDIACRAWEYRSGDQIVAALKEQA